MVEIMVIGLDWDDTITSYTKGIAQLCKGNTVVIITLNKDVTTEVAQKLLRHNVAGVFHMPDSEFDTMAEDVGVGKWKAKICIQEVVDVMIDDLQSVCDACAEVGVPSIQVHLKD